MSQAECEGKGCCWAPAQFDGAPHVDLPWCFTPNAGPSEYRAARVKEATGAAAAGCIPSGQACGACDWDAQGGSGWRFV